MSFNYKIDESNGVQIFADGSLEPCLVQNMNPNGESWADKAEAEKWAKAYLKGIEQRIADAIAEMKASEEAAALLAAEVAEQTPAEPEAPAEPQA